jgi:hypothetical protein
MKTLKFKENCGKCDLKQNCGMYRPQDLADTVKCIDLHGAVKICKRSIFKIPALNKIYGKTPGNHLNLLKAV